MDGKQKLEILRLIKYLDYLKVDFKFKNELYTEYDIEFRKKVEKIIQEKKELNEIIPNEKYIIKKEEER